MGATRHRDHAHRAEAPAHGACRPVLAFSVLALAGCPFDPHGQGMVADDVPVIDAVDTPGCACPLGCRGDGTCADYAPSNGGDFPLLAGATEGLSLPDGNYVLDSDAMTITGPSGPVALTGLVSQAIDNLWVIGVTGLSLPVGANVRGTGARAIKILSAGDVTIAGVIDVSGGCVTGGATWCAGPGGGAGGHPSTEDRSVIAATGCGAGAPGTGSTTIAESGGGGGFGTPGGAGGDGNGVATTPGGIAGVVCAGALALIPLAGGGGGGGAGYATITIEGRTSGGGGGGALQISSLTAIEVSGVLRAAGAGGSATVGDDGGGGGGAGGGLLLEAPAIRLLGTARVVANGGGGGAGFDTGASRNGERGRDDRVRAAGGLNAAGTHGGFGAIGAVAGEDATAGDDATDGGCGGGGGAGSVHLNTFASPMLAAIISPPASLGSIAPR